MLASSFIERAKYIALIMRIWREKGHYQVNKSIDRENLILESIKLAIENRKRRREEFFDVGDYSSCRNLTQQIKGLETAIIILRSV